MNRVLGRVFDDDDVFRIDHYLGKETVQNLLVFRFANLLFEPLWNRLYIDHVQITAAETVGVGSRAAYYDSAGAMRDMIQSHLLQLMAVVAMEPPNSFRASDLRSEQRHVLEAVRPISPDEVPRLAVRAQYARAQVDGAVAPGYREEPDVPADSSCDTFAALKLFIDNWRWEGVPFFLRTGKCMRRKLTQFVINFKPAPHLFRNVDGGEIRPSPNRLIVNVQPDEGISLRFEGKVPGLGLHIQSAVLDFDYRQQFRPSRSRPTRRCCSRRSAATSRTTRIAMRSRPPGASSCRCSTTGATTRAKALSPTPREAGDRRRPTS